MDEHLKRQIIDNTSQYAEDIKDIKCDKVNHPDYYCSHPSGIECITITRHHNFSIGNAIKYLWRAGLKKEEGLTSINKEIEDLKKAVWYINDRIKYLESTQSVIDEKYGKKK